MESTGDNVLAIAAKLERQLEVAQEITHIGSWEWEMATDKVVWSSELYRIYGMTPGSRDISFDYFMSRLHPDDRERVSGEIRAALARGGRFAHRERIVRPDGTVRELDSVGEVVVDAAGTPTGLIGTCRDITDEVRREKTIQLFADVVESLQIGLSVWRIESRAPASIRLVASNHANERLVGLSAASAGQSLGECFPAALSSEIPQLLLNVDREQPRGERPACRVPKLPGCPTFAVTVFSLGADTVGLGLEDVTARVRLERMQSVERRALEMLANGAPLASILDALVLAIEDLAPETLASILMLDPSGTRLVHGAAPSLPDAYNRAIDGQPIGPSAGSCGTAAFRHSSVFVSNIATDPLWTDYKDLALSHGLHACWSTPILSTDERVLGTFALYYREPREADPGVVELIERAVHIASIAIERRQLDEQLRALSSRIESIREDERTGIAREIHDELGQAMTALKIDLGWVVRRRGDDPEVGGKLREMSRAIDDVLQAVRRISSELRPGILDDVGLQAAIEWQAEEFSRRSGMPCVVRSALGDLRLDRELATATFRIFQEALTNITRHASATHVEVDLMLERGKLRLEISDDGIGMPEQLPRIGSLGLLGMRERARRLGGDCTIKRREQGGTTVTLLVPLRFPAELRLSG